MGQRETRREVKKRVGQRETERGRDGERLRREWVRERRREVKKRVGQGETERG